MPNHKSSGSMAQPHSRNVVGCFYVALHTPVWVLVESNDMTLYYNVIDSTTLEEFVLHKAGLDGVFR